MCKNPLCCMSWVYLSDLVYHPTHRLSHQWRAKARKMMCCTGSCRQDPIVSSAIQVRAGTLLTLPMRMQVHDAPSLPRHQIRSDQIIYHFFQPHQADQILTPPKRGRSILVRQALTNFASPIRTSCHMNACMVLCNSSEMSCSPHGKHRRHVWLSWVCGTAPSRPDLDADLRAAYELLHGG